MAGPIYGGYSGYSSYSNYTQPYGMQSAQSLATQFNSNFNVARPEPPKKKSGGIFGAIKDVATGFVKGAINTVKSLATPQGLLMLAAGIALVVATGGAATPFLIGAGVAMGGAKMATSAAKGDWEGVGEGLFGVTASVAGARMGPKSFTQAGTGKVFTTPNLSATGGGRFSNMIGTARNYGNFLRGKTTLLDDAGNATNMTIGQLAKSNAGHFYNNNPVVLNTRAAVGDFSRNAGSRLSGMRTSAGEAYTSFRANPSGTARTWGTTARDTAGRWYNQGRQYATNAYDSARTRYANFRNGGANPADDGIIKGTFRVVDDAPAIQPNRLAITDGRPANIARDSYGNQLALPAPKSTALATVDDAGTALATVDDTAAAGAGRTGTNTGTNTGTGTHGTTSGTDALRARAQANMRAEYDALNARVAAGERLNPLESQWMTYYGRALGETGSASFAQKVATPFQFLAAGARTYPGGAAATIGAGQPWFNPVERQAQGYYA